MLRVFQALGWTMQTRMLGNPREKAKRLTRIHEPLIAPLTDFVERRRRTVDPHTPGWMPYFDPESGGVRAQILFLLESPGPRVSKTQFVSSDNPDGTAENMSRLLEKAQLSRDKILLWNIFPWQLSPERVVTPSKSHLLEAVPTTLELLKLLPELKVIVLVGKKAEAGWKHAAVPVNPAIEILRCPHPSPQHFNTNPEAAALALSVLVQARQLCS